MVDRWMSVLFPRRVEVGFDCVLQLEKYKSDYCKEGLKCSPLFFLKQQQLICVELIVIRRQSAPCTQTSITGACFREKK